MKEIDSLECQRSEFQILMSNLQVLSTINQFLRLEVHILQSHDDISQHPIAKSEASMCT